MTCTIANATTAYEILQEAFAPERRLAGHLEEIPNLGNIETSAAPFSILWSSAAPSAPTVYVL